jgi:hypothetical protein
MLTVPKALFPGSDFTVNTLTFYTRGRTVPPPPVSIQMYAWTIGNPIASVVTFSLTPGGYLTYTPSAMDAPKLTHIYQLDIVTDPLLVGQFALIGASLTAY